MVEVQLRRFISRHCGAVVESSEAAVGVSQFLAAHPH